MGREQHEKEDKKKTRGDEGFNMKNRIVCQVSFCFLTLNFDFWPLILIFNPPEGMNFDFFRPFDRVADD